MKFLRWLGAGVVWIVAGLLGVVGVLLSVTIILLPLGVPIILLARRLFALSAKMVLPRAARHPVEETGNAVRAGAEELKKAVPGRGKGARRRSRKLAKDAKAAVPTGS